MIELESDGWYHINSRGDCATFRDCNQLPEDMPTPYLLLNTQVEIDGKEYNVKGVEMFCTPDRETRYWRGHGFSLMIGER